MSKRAAIVRDHILEHGAVTTDTLATVYGYGHPPRAKRDLIDAGAGVETRMITVDGKRMAEYFFTGVADKNAAGRVMIPKKFADELKESHGFRCAVCTGLFAGRELQADHRVPFAVGGDKPTMAYEDFMPLCASDNRAKSWSCEHCPNWTIKDVETCETCFWAHPEQYEHVETRQERRINLTFQGSETDLADKIIAESNARGVTAQSIVKEKISR